MYGTGAFTSKRSCGELKGQGSRAPGITPKSTFKTQSYLKYLSQFLHPISKMSLSCRVHRGKLIFLYIYFLKK